MAGGVKELYVPRWLLPPLWEGCWLWTSIPLQRHRPYRSFFPTAWDSDAGKISHSLASPWEADHSVMLLCCSQVAQGLCPIPPPPPSGDHRSLPFMGVWRDHSEECEIKGDVEKETGEKWPHFRQGVRAHCLRDNGMETVSRFKDNLLGPTRVVRRDWEEGSFTSEFNPVQQNMLGILTKHDMLSAARGYKGALTSWGSQIPWESEESYRPLETSLHTVSEGIPHFWNSSASSTPALYENLQAWDSAESWQRW